MARLMLGLAAVFLLLAIYIGARLSVNVPGADLGIVRELVDIAHGICPYSKATHGNINIATTVV